MLGDKKFSFIEALSSGIYFDRCIDLQAFDSDMNLLWCLNTPKNGYKPDITVKGEMIGGSQVISTFISITNLAYDAQINDVAYVLCRMYYRGLIGKQVGDLDNYQGNSVLFSVLYADQEKEPPNRAVRFQCTIAAIDYTRLGTRIYVDANGKFSKDKITDNGTSGDGNKASLLKPMKEVLLEMAKIYNLSLDAKFKKDSKRTQDLQIYKINFECEAHENAQIAVANYNGTMLGLLNTINASCVNINSQSMNAWNATIVKREKCELDVNIVLPADSSLKDNKYFKRRENGGSYEVTTSQTKAQGNEKNTQNSKVVELFYVNYATRSETVITVSTMFDPRIFPQCACAIMGNTIMGKNRRRSAKNDGSRLSKVTDNVVVFYAEGGIEFEFSTTQKSYMTLQGPIDKIEDMNWEQYKKWKEQK